MLTLGEVIRAGREAKGWSQYRLAQECGLAETAVRDVESGRRPDPRWTTVRILARALDLQLDHLSSQIAYPEKAGKSA